MEIRWRWLLVVATCAWALGCLIGLLAFPEARQFLRRGGAENSSGIVQIGGPFELLSHTGQRVSDQNFRGRPLLVTFGRSADPDLTPATLQTLAAILDQLGAKADRVTALFITLDASTDTPEVLSRYLSGFHPRLLGLTGTPEQIAAIARLYKVSVVHSSNTATVPSESYIYNPTIFLMDSKGIYVSHLTQDMDSTVVVHRLQEML